MLEALAWGSLAAGSLVLGALLAFARPWSDRQIGLVLAFGAGALISAVSLELAEEGVRAGGFAWTAVGLAAGALT
jgi:ZIP family zinc transporter